MWNVLIDPSNERKIADFRTLGMSDLIVLGRYQYARAHEALPAHNHYDMFEITLMDTGEQLYEVEGDLYSLRGGDVLVVQPHALHSTGNIILSRARAYWMIISIPRQHKHFLGLPPADGQQLAKALTRISARPFHGRNSLKNSLESIFAAYDKKETPFRKAEIQNQALRFLLDILEDAEQPVKNTVRYAIRNAQNYVALHLADESLNLEVLAKAAGLSLPHFKARFKKETGFTPGNYIARKRIERAKELLESGDHPITQIGLELGFSSSQYFATVFKKHTGLTPQAWRNRSNTTD